MPEGEVSGLASTGGIAWEGSDTPSGQFSAIHDLTSGGQPTFRGRAGAGQCPAGSDWKKPPESLGEGGGVRTRVPSLLLLSVWAPSPAQPWAIPGHWDLEPALPRPPHRPPPASGTAC